MTPADLFRIQWVSDARLAPDGRTLAFSVTRLDEEADDYRSAIWIVPADGSAPPRRFTSGGGKDSAPCWSPDGTRLAFLSDRDGGKAQVYVIDIAGGEARKLSDIPQGAGAPEWSPDSTRLVTVVRTGGEDEERRPDSRKLKTPPARLITTLKYRYNGEGFTYDRRRHLFVIDAASGATHQLTQGDWDDTQPAWSPDGRSIAYLGYADTADAPCNSRLWLVPAAGGPPRCLTAQLDRDLAITETAAPIWQADGAAIIVGVQDRGTVGMIQAQVANGTVLPLVHGRRCVTSYSVANTTLAFTAAEPHRPAEVYVRTALGEHQVTALNADWCATVELPKPDHFTVCADGGEIDAWVMRPAGFAPGRRYPTLVNIHGGPFVQYGWTFFDEFQVQTGAGYAVLFCNPRGSSGREDAFARAIVGCPGEPDSADVLAMLDEALRRYDFLDPTRLGLIGGSYGGYLAGWIVGHTDRFAAAVPERGLYNRYSKDGTSDIWSGYTYLRAHQWENPWLYWRYSPIAYVQNIRTPLLILHSEEDLRCPIAQAEQLFTALKQMRREVRFVPFSGENYELSHSGKPSHRVQRFGYILDRFSAKLSAAVGQQRAAHNDTGPCLIFVRKALRTRTHMFVTMLALKVVREIRRGLVAAFGTTDDDKMAVTVEDALLALARLWPTPTF
jgi:dipeptidyl aminopeptidase/acylaminoacyl peptidase